MSCVISQERCTARCDMLHHSNSVRQECEATPKAKPKLRPTPKGSTTPKRLPMKRPSASESPAPKPKAKAKGKSAPSPPNPEPERATPPEPEQVEAEDDDQAKPMKRPSALRRPAAFGSDSAAATAADETASGHRSRSSLLCFHIHFPLFCELFCVFVRRKSLTGFSKSIQWTIPPEDPSGVLASATTSGPTFLESNATAVRSSTLVANILTLRRQKKPWSGAQPVSPTSKNELPSSSTFPTFVCLFDVRFEGAREPIASGDCSKSAKGWAAFGLLSRVGSRVLSFSSPQFSAPDTNGSCFRRACKANFPRVVNLPRHLKAGRRLSFTNAP